MAGPECALLRRGRGQAVSRAAAVRSPAAVMAERLRAELERRGITADVNEGDGLALVSVWVHLVVWCESGPDGWRYRWWTGRTSQQSRRWVWTSCPSTAVETAGRRVAERYAEVRRSHPLSAVVAGMSAGDGVPRQRGTEQK